MSKRAQPVRQARAERTLESLLDAVERLIVQSPVQSISVRKIALEADCTTGAIYQRFQDKQALIDASFDRFIERGGTVLEMIDEAVEHKGLEETVGFFVDFVAQLFQASGPLIVAYRQFAQGKPDYMERLTEFGNGLSLKLSKWLSEFEPYFAGEPGSSAVDFAVRQVLAVYDQKILFEPVEPVLRPLDWEQLSAELTRSTISYLRMSLESRS